MIQIPVKKTQEAFTWGVQYTDDTCIAEYDREDRRNFAEVDQSRVKELLLLSLAGDTTHSVRVPQDATPIFFRRHPLEINLMQGTGALHPTVHCIGWKRGDEAVYLFVFDDDSTLLSNDLQAV